MAGPDSLLSRALAALAVLACLFAAACASGGGAGNPAAGGVYKVGQPYQVDGNWYYPQEDPLYDETGIASWYGKEFHGRRTANGEVFDAKLVTAAHKTLPMPTNVRITNLENGRQVVARVNDRGPFKASRLIDVSERAADLLGFRAKGMARVRVQFLGVADLPNGRPGKRVDGIGAQASLDDDAPTSGAKAAPTSNVSGGELPPPPGAVAAAPAPRPKPAPVPIPTPKASPLDEPGTVTTVPVHTARLYVQAGAFVGRDNAQRLLVRLRSIADFTISAKMQDGKRYYRVRAGPIATVGEADAILNLVLMDGQKGATIVVE
ncbi:MAG: septal ring lytic transglycosylase RlpA family protein [Alphaproteobacteria bacterium]|nr:septal ring lytic transglycosylase RlpA family protein [Alphaproteobacteria bacterium]